MTEEEKKERHKEYMKKYRERHRERINTAAREARKRDPERFLEIKRRHRKKNIERYRIKDAEYQRKRFARLRELNPEKAMLLISKQNAPRRGLEFSITEEDINIPNECPVFKRPFEPGTRYAASIDRIDNTKGYVKGNIQVISMLANSMKQNSSPEELKQFAEWILNCQSI